MREKAGNQASNRKEYRNLAALMVKVEKDIKGSHLAMDELAAKLIAWHPRRTAVKEELSIVLKMRLISTVVN